MSLCENCQKTLALAVKLNDSERVALALEVSVSMVQAALGNRLEQGASYMMEDLIRSRLTTQGRDAAARISERTGLPATDAEVLAEIDKPVVTELRAPAPKRRRARAAIKEAV